MSPSILSCNFLHLYESIHAVYPHKSSRIHLDIMDGHYVPNISFGSPILHSLKNYPCDIHLMIKNPEKIMPYVCDNHILSLTVHIDKHQNMEFIHKNKNRTSIGIAVNPDETFDEVLPYLYVVQHVTIMTVYPGLPGQKFIHSQINMIRQISSYSKENNLSITIHVDGGINAENGFLCHKAGAQVLVTGSYLFDEGIKKAPIKAQEILNKCQHM